jgi:hypothetical protein
MCALQIAVWSFRHIAFCLGTAGVRCGVRWRFLSLFLQKRLNRCVE